MANEGFPVTSDCCVADVRGSSVTMHICTMTQRSHGHYTQTEYLYHPLRTPTQPSTLSGGMSTGQSAVTLCDWGVTIQVWLVPLVDKRVGGR